MDTNIDNACAALSAKDADMPAEFFFKLEVEKYLDQLDQAVPLATGERHHLNKLLDTEAHGSFKQLDKDYPKQQRGNELLNEVLINNAELSQREKEAVMKFKQHHTNTTPFSGDFALGNILVANGNITRPQLEQALRQQIKSGRRLGEELITSGHTSTGQVEKGLLLQSKLLACALAATVGLAPVAATTAEAAQTSAAMAVSVTVVAHAKMHTYFQESQLNISKKDIERGYVDAPAALRFSVVSNSQSGYLMEFYPVGNLFDSVRISGLGNAVQMGTDGGAVVQRGPLRANPAVELSFHFVLHPDVLPGNYPWPLQLSVRSL
jgi:hypothetical protein